MNNVVIRRGQIGVAIIALFNFSIVPSVLKIGLLMLIGSLHVDATLLYFYKRAKDRKIP